MSKHVSITGKMSFGARLRAYLIAGILVTAPISITLFLSWRLINFVDNRVSAVLPERFNPETYLPFSVPGIGVVIILVALILIGALTAGFLGRFLMRQFDLILARIPAVRSLYGATKQIFETVLANQSSAFREVVLVEYPRRGMWVLAFITGTTEGEVQNLTEDTLINVFIPTTPNPTSGFLIFVPKAEVRVLEMTIEEGIKMVVSGGIITPPDRRPPERQVPEIAARADGGDEAIEGRARGAAVGDRPPGRGPRDPVARDPAVIELGARHRDGGD
ncbi:MAG: DUF502 domain-containing protein [Azospirillaceae bacterium]